MRLLFVAIVTVTSASALAEEPLLQPIEAAKEPLKSELIEALDRAIEDAGPDADAALFRTRGRLYAEAGRWKRAAADFEHLANRNPSNLNMFQQAGIAMLLGGDRMNYEKLVEGFLAAHKDDEANTTLEKRVKLCVLPPGPIAEQAEVEAWIKQAVEMSDENSSWAPYFPASQAMAYYRYGKYEEALKAVAETDRRNAVRGGTNKILYIRTRLTEAMCLAKQGEIDKATAVFEKADTLLRRHLATTQFLQNNKYWHDWMVGKLMHDEACSVLQAALANAQQPE